MKKLVFFAIFGGLMIGCVAKPYVQDEVEKGKQRGFHHNQAQSILDANAQNKAKNAQANEKAKASENERLNALNKNKTKGASSKDRIFSFY